MLGLKGAAKLSNNGYGLSGFGAQAF